MAEIKDKPSDSIPSIADRRESQRKGAEGKGTNPEDTKLNECQGHEVDIKD